MLKRGGADFSNQIIQHFNERQIDIPNFQLAVGLNENDCQMPGIMAISSLINDQDNNGVVHDLAFYFGLKKQFDRHTNLAQQPNGHNQHHTERQLLHAAMQNPQVLDGQSHVYLYTPQPPCFAGGIDNGGTSCLQHYHNQINNNPNLHLVVFFSKENTPNARRDLIPKNIIEDNFKMQRFAEVLATLPLEDIHQIILSLQNNDIFPLRDLIPIFRALLNNPINKVNNIMELSEKQKDILRNLFNRFVKSNLQHVIQVEGQPINLIEHIYNSVYGINNRLIFKYIHIQ